MTDQQKSTAMALLRSGRSYQEAADASKLPVADVMAVWSAMRRMTLTPSPDEPAVVGVERINASPMAYLQLIAQGWSVIESDGWTMTIQAPEDWHEAGPGELVVDTAVWRADFEPVTCTDHDIENVTDIALTLERTYLECGSITARDNAAAMRSVLAYANRYRFLRHAEISRPEEGGLFIGETPSNVILTEEDADRAIDASMRRDTFFDDDPMTDAPHDQLQKAWDDAQKDAPQ